MTRRALAVLLLTLPLTGCAEPPVAARSTVTVAASATRGDGLLTVTFRVGNDGEGPVMFRRQPEPYVRSGPDGTTEIAVGRFAVPADTFVTVPDPRVPMRTVPPGTVAEETVRLPWPLRLRQPPFDAPGGPAPMPSGEPRLTFCVGVAPAPAVSAEPVEAVQFADDPAYCVPVRLVASLPATSAAAVAAGVAGQRHSARTVSRTHLSRRRPQLHR